MLRYARADQSLLGTQVTILFLLYKVFKKVFFVNDSMIQTPMTTVAQVEIPETISCMLTPLRVIRRIMMTFPHAVLVLSILS